MLRALTQYIYNKYPPAIEETTKLVYLPLHNACAKNNPNLEIIQFLVDAYPEALLAITKLGDTPLRAAERNTSTSPQVLQFLQEETDRISSLEQHQELWSSVSARQSWGSTNTTETKTILEAVAMAMSNNNKKPAAQITLSSEAFSVSSTEISQEFSLEFSVAPEPDNET